MSLLSTDTVMVLPGPRGNPIGPYMKYAGLSSGRSSDFPGHSAAFPFDMRCVKSQTVAFMAEDIISRRKNGITAAGPSPIHTGFPFHPHLRNLNGFLYLIRIRLSREIYSLLCVCFACILYVVLLAEQILGDICYMIYSAG